MITFVTGNENKLKEVKALLGDQVTSRDVDLPELQGTYAEIIAHKLAGAAEQVQGPVMVEDTALEFSALGKELPGPYIKWFLKQLGPQGLPRLLDGFESRAGAAVCTVGFCEGPGKPIKIFTGRTEGTITTEPRGPTNFGWDPIFQPDGHTVTYAEMEPEVKHSISHRGKAMRAFKEYLDSR